MKNNTIVLNNSEINLLKKKLKQLIIDVKSENQQKLLKLTNLLDDIIIIQKKYPNKILQNTTQPNRYLLLNYWPNKYIDLDNLK